MQCGLSFFPQYRGQDLSAFGNLEKALAIGKACFPFSEKATMSSHRVMISATAYVMADLKASIKSGLHLAVPESSQSHGTINREYFVQAKAEMYRTTEVRVLQAEALNF